MRKLIYAINLTLDRCADHRKFGGSDEMMEHYTQLMHEVDLEVFGRKTYELMIPYWPDVAKNATGSPLAVKFAQVFDEIQKVVFSQTLTNAEDKTTRITRASLEDEVGKLKQEHGKSILVRGVDVASQLIKLGLVDEYRIVVGPFIAGEGRRLMEDVSLPERLNLKLTETKVFKSGCVALNYVND